MRSRDPADGGYIAAFHASFRRLGRSPAPFNVPTCPAGADDAIVDDRLCELQASEFAPLRRSSQSRGTVYQLRLVLDGSDCLVRVSCTTTTSRSIRRDRCGDISKTTPMVNVMRGQMVPYVISVKNTWAFPLTDVNSSTAIRPASNTSKDRRASTTWPLEPTDCRPELIWRNLTLAAQGEHTIKLLLAPGAGVTEGKFTNSRAGDSTLTGQALSGQASATVRIVPDPTFDCTDVTGKVFDDHNRNGVQEEGEAGIAGADSYRRRVSRR